LATVAEVEELLHTEYHYYEHNESGGSRIACDDYALPHRVRDYVDFIMPTIQLDGLRPTAQKQALNKAEALFDVTGLSGVANCSTFFTIDCLRAIYKVPVARYNHSGNELGIPEWGDYLYLPDLKTFFENYTSPKIPSDVVPNFISIDGGRGANLSDVTNGDTTESGLDFQTAYSLLWPQQVRLYQVGDGNSENSFASFNIFLDALVSEPILHLVLD
jgi:tripeptidyl-peptidase-1